MGNEPEKLTKMNTDLPVYAICNYSNRYVSPVIKWYQVKMTYEEKYRFNLLTYPEYLEWMEELSKEESASNDGKTFWSNDSGERTNVSSAEYEDFLANNNIDVSNSSTINFEALAASVNGSEPVAEIPPPPADAYEPSMDEILANVNKDIHGGDAILSQEEIEALFAAAAANG